MNRQDLERLIAMLRPIADADDITFVIDKIMSAMPQPAASSSKRSAQQNIDPYETTLANDPRYW